MPKHIVTKCRICKAECIPSVLTHLNIYIDGSEGIRVCPLCSRLMTDIVRTIINGIERRLRK